MITVMPLLMSIDLTSRLASQEQCTWKELGLQSPNCVSAFMNLNVRVVPEIVLTCTTIWRKGIELEGGSRGGHKLIT
jgi:hypothetical protein